MNKNTIEIKYKESVLVSEEEIRSVALRLSEYLGFLKSVTSKREYDVPESFLLLSDDKELFKKTEDVAALFNGDPLKYIVVVGIGGSNLGASAVYDAIFPKRNLLSSVHPKLIFSDTTNPREMEAVKNIIRENVHDPKEIVLNIITKSGTTVETVANAMVLFEELSSLFGESEVLSRTVITTDEGSPLWKVAFDKQMHILPIPKKVGGRYSVFSPVGIFPLKLAGINVSKFISGAVSIRESLLSENQNENPALLCSAIDFLVHKNGLSIYNSFFFNSELESVGKWGRQLFAESLGKKYDKKGVVVNAGMTPIVSLGSTDLHSMVQLYLGGPRDKFTNFISAFNENGDHVAIPVSSPFSSLVPDIIGKDFQKILSSILGGTMEAYKVEGFPFVETVLPGISEQTLGQYFMLKMMETILLGKLWDVDAFDQPEVESYKKAARELLKR
ncbi:hypothetical protein D4R99_01780 [bacterium]|nr:MAG: hypothetical protein D4R99_01780 [bacterium]